MLKKDDDGRYPLSSSEYTAIRHVIAAVDACSKHYDTLSERLRLVKWGARDYKLVHAKAYKLFEKLLETIPFKKLKVMRAELDASVCEVRVNAASVNRELGYTVLDVDDLRDLANLAVESRCFLCYKSAVEGRKCPVYKAICACLPYKPDGVSSKGACPLAGSAELRDEF